MQHAVAFRPRPNATVRQTIAPRDKQAGPTRRAEPDKPACHRKHPAQTPEGLSADDPCSSPTIRIRQQQNAKCRDNLSLPQQPRRSLQDQASSAKDMMQSRQASSPADNAPSPAINLRRGHPSSCQTCPVGQRSSKERSKRPKAHERSRPQHARTANATTPQTLKEPEDTPALDQKMPGTSRPAKPHMATQTNLVNHPVISP